MDVQILEGYLKQAQELSCMIDVDPGALQVLLHFIELSKDQSLSDPLSQELFKGEYAFYSGHYERALKHYLQCKGLPRFEFFCYRASAYISKAQGHLDKAHSFLKKALEIYPDDAPSLTLQGEMLMTTECAEEVRNSMESKPKTDHSCLHPLDKESKLTINKDDLKELVGIFSASRTDDDLFAAEQRQGSQANYSAVCVDLFSASFEVKPSSFGCYGEANISAEPRLSQTFQESDKENLSESLRSFQNLRSHAVAEYDDQWIKRSSQPDHCIYMLQGWEGAEDKNMQNSPKTNVLSLLDDTLHKLVGGYFIRWNGKGVVINPGKHFLRNFHQSGLHLKDIHFVIVTQENAESYSDIKEIYDLAYQLNQASNEFHLIHYYLHHKAFQALNGILKPHFKQERHAMHHLQLFFDSDVEKIDLSDDIRLNYFLAAGPAPENSAQMSQRHDFLHHHLGIRLELALSNGQSQIANEEIKTINVGYISGVRWHESFSQNLGACDILIAGVGKTNSADYHMIAYLENDLGYYGVFSLFEKMAPKLLLCTEFDSRQGDIRLEMVKKMRFEQHQHLQNEFDASTILPSEQGLFVDLKTNQIKCSLTGKLVDSQKILVVRPKEMFGRLQYLSPSCYI